MIVFIKGKQKRLPNVLAEILLKKGKASSEPIEETVKEKRKRGPNKSKK